MRDEAARLGAEPGNEKEKTRDERPTEHPAHDHGDEDVDSLRQRLLISLALTIPVVLMAMVPALQFDNWQWLSRTLASPVVVWGALPFHKAAWANAKHGAATRDTRISVGVAAA